MTIEEVNEILLKYKKEEAKIDDLLQKRFNISDGDNTSAVDQKVQEYLIPTEQDAMERNANLLKELKTVKGNLRSKAIYSPVEMRWEEICKNYLEKPSLPVTSWKCRLPVFV